MKNINKTSNPSSTAKHPNSRFAFPSNFTQILCAVLFSFMCCLEAQAEIYWVTFSSTTVSKADEKRILKLLCKA